MSKLGKVPVFEDGDLVVPDSSVICTYLERARPRPALYPGDAADLARVLWYEEYADTRLTEVLLVPFFQRVVRPQVFQEGPDEERIRRSLADDLPPVLDYLEGVTPDGDGIVGDRFSVADVAVCSPFVNFQMAGEAVDRSRWPRLAPYVERTLARPAFARAIGIGAQAA